LTSFAKRTKLPEDLMNKIKRYLENNNQNFISLEDSKHLLNELPLSLRAEVVK
jgi:hypothetical protein